MKYIILIGLFSLSFLKSHSQVADTLLYNAQLKDQKASARLDSVYNAVVKKYKSDRDFTKLLKRAQTQWKQLLEIEMQMKFFINDGETSPQTPAMCFSLYRAELINERANRLEQWLTGTKTDPCAGHVKADK